MVNSTVHDVRAAALLFVIVYLPSKPVPQSEPLENVAETPPAPLAAGTTTIPRTIAATAAKRAARCHRNLDIGLLSRRGTGTMWSRPLDGQGLDLCRHSNGAVRKRLRSAGCPFSVYLVNHWRD